MSCVWLVNYDECSKYGGTCDSCMCDEYEKDDSSVYMDDEGNIYKEED